MKKKIHINSLPSNRQVASHDCRHCTKRRIRCDRSLPNCEKCTSRYLQCPGFALRCLKWNQGIASRGKLKGKARPILESNETNKNSITSDKPWIEEQSLSSLVSHKSAPNEVPSATLETIPGPVKTIPTTSPGQDSGLIKNHTLAHTFEHLIHHFFHEVVPRFRWIDLPDNPWRDTIRPIAQDSHCLQVAMACHAAAHLSITWTGPAHVRTSFRDVYHHLRDSSLRIVNERIRSGLLCESDPSKAAFLRCFPVDVLASNLLLCYADAFIPGSIDWKLHLRACQIVIRSHVSHGQLNRNNSSCKNFLLKEVADLEILSSISSFDRDNSCASTYSFSPPLHSSSPWTFTQLIHQITTMERRRYDSIQSQQPVPDMQLQLLYHQVEEAYLGVLAAIGPYLEQQSARKCLETVILSHYYAVMIYSSQALGTPAELDSTVDSFLDPLQSCVQWVISGTDQQFSHDLFIPLFIIGTECRGDVQRQNAVEDLFLKILFITGMWWNHTALQFLRAFWSSGKSNEMTWLQYGHEKDTHVDDFILF